MRMRKLQKNLPSYFPRAAGILVLAVLLGVGLHYTPASVYQPATAKAGGTNITGFAWSDNIGWICFDDATYCSTSNVTVDGSGVLSGYAWSENIGWINFGANSCGAQATLANGTLTGWAQAPAAASGWDGCIKLSDSAAPAYGPTLSGTDFDGYAWGSDTVGWISFNCASGGPTGNNICATSNYKVSYGGSPSPTCTLSVALNPAATGSSIALNYTTTNSPTIGTIKDMDGTVLTNSATNATGAIATTSPLSAGSYTYTMNVSNVAGSGSCTAVLTDQTDVCTDISGLQSSAPASPCVTPVPSPGQCVPSGYTWNGSACVILTPTISSFIGPAHVRKGDTATLTYTVTNPPASCSVTGNNGFSTTVSPTSGVQGSVTTGAITTNTVFTLTCGSVSQTATVGLTPSVQEL